MAKVVFGFGSNVGQARLSIQTALDSLSKFVEIESVSSLYVSRPMYKLDQPDFVNSVAIGETKLSPSLLLNRLKEIEKQIGRIERERNGPREIDIDIVAYGSLQYRLTIATEIRLEIPHPKVSERRFVLLPLAEVAPNLLIPGLGTADEILRLTESQSQDVRREENEILSIQRPR